MDLSREDVLTSLYHVDLPRLDEVGVVAFDADRETVRPLRPATGLLAAADRIAATGQLAVDEPTRPGRRRI